MTAWAAKFCTNAICLSVNGRTSCAVEKDNAHQRVVLNHRHADERSKTPNLAGGSSTGSAAMVLRFGSPVLVTHYAVEVAT